MASFPATGCHTTTMKWFVTVSEPHTFSFMAAHQPAQSAHSQLADFDRWQTSWGTKTNAGLARTILAQIEESRIETAKDREVFSK